MLMLTPRANLSQLIGLPDDFPIKRRFRDRYELRSYVRLALLAEKLMNHPELISRGSAYLERFTKNDPRQLRTYQVWTDLLRLPVPELVSALLADDERGAWMRETSPVFVVIPPQAIREVADLAA